MNSNKHIETLYAQDHKSVYTYSKISSFERETYSKMKDRYKPYNTAISLSDKARA